MKTMKQKAIAVLCGFTCDELAHRQTTRSNSRDSYEYDESQYCFN